MSPDIWPIVIAWGKSQPPLTQHHQRLIEYELKNWSSPPHTSPESANAAILERVTLLQSTIQALEEHPIPLLEDWTKWIAPLWRFWLPLAQQLDKQQKALGTPFIQGILGGQGTGKTTLTAVLQLILQQLGHQILTLSIDDLYLTYAQRQVIRQQDPRLVWRGPPGTHDIDLGLALLFQVKAKKPVSVPQFDKSLYSGQGDRVAPIHIDAPTIVLFEGWLVGVRPIPDAAFTNAVLPEPIVTADDRQFARDNNQRLKAYQPLWKLLDSLIVLNPCDYRLSKQWRQEAEHRMIAIGKPGLSNPEIAAFVTYFWKALHPELFIRPSVLSSETALVVNINPDHTLGDIYVPASGQDDSVYTEI